MNRSSFPVSSTYSAVLTFSLAPALDSDAWDVRGGISPDEPGSELPRLHAVSELDAKLIRATQVRGTGPLVKLIDGAVQTVATKVLTASAFHAALTRRLDFALFAVDHDDGHGPERVAAGVRELWAQSGAKTWEDCAQRRERILAWMREAGQP